MVDFRRLRVNQGGLVTHKNRLSKKGLLYRNTRPTDDACYDRGTKVYLFLAKRVSE